MDALQVADVLATLAVGGLVALLVVAALGLTRRDQFHRLRRALSGQGAALGCIVAVVALLGAVGVVVAMAGGGSAKDGGQGAVFSPVQVEGAPLGTLETGPDDAARGRPAPTVRGSGPAGEPVSVGGASTQPTLVVFLAHWCSHCQRELPVLVGLERTGRLEGVRLVAVLTGTDRKAPNFPPAPWLVREGWPGDVLVDDEASTAGQSYGLNGYPFLVILDPDGRVTARTSGEQPGDVVAALAQAAKR